MIDLKQFRKVNRLGQAEVAAFLGVTVPSVSAYETGRAFLSKENEQKLLNNNRGWLVPSAQMVAEPQAPYGQTAQNWPSIVADLSAKIGEQNSQIDRLLSIVEQLTSQKK